MQDALNKPQEKRKKAEQTLRESEEKYRALFENMAQGAFYQRADGKLIDVNPAALEMFGLSRNQFLKRTSLSPQWRVIREDGSKLPAKEHPSMTTLKTGKPVRNVILAVYNPVHKEYIWMNISAIPQFRPGEKKPFQTFVTLHDITERKRAEEATRLQATLVNSASDAIIATDKNFNITVWNKSAEYIYGWKADEVIGQSIQKLLSAEFYQTDEREVEKQLYEKGYWSGVLKQRCKDGRVVHILGSTSQLRDSAGKLYGAVTINRDITERKRTEKALEESEARYRSLIDEASIGIVVTVGSKIVFCNQKESQLFGYKTPSDLQGHSIIEFVYKDDLPKVTEMAKQIKSGQKMEESVTFRGIRRDGKDLFIEARAIQVRFANSESLLSFHSDITERKKSEMALEQTQLLLEAVLEQSPIPIVAVSAPELVVRYKNRAAADFLGVIAEPTYVGLTLRQIKQRQTWRDFNPDGTPISLLKLPLARALRGETTRNEEYRVIRKDGTQRWELVSASPIYSHSGKLVAGLVIFPDITERKRAEEQIQKDLREKEILIKELYHRTKNNMQVISSMLRLHSRDIKDPKTTGILLNIENKIMTMALVHQRLYESRDLSHLNLKEYIDDLVSLIKRSHLVSSDQITFTTKGEDINVLIDTAIPVGLIINELITNALKYAFPGNRRGEIKITLFRTEKNELVIEVSDNGAGLPKGFDLQKDSHLGIGLVIDLVEHQLQGKISFISKQGLLWRIFLKKELYEPRV
jgi:PAS domain S-box-containing protein